MHGLSEWQRHKPACKVWKRELLEAITKMSTASSITSERDGEEECPVCLEFLHDAISPCQVAEHKLCRACVEGMRRAGVNNVCPQCRGDMSDADQLFTEAISLSHQARRTGGSKAAELHRLSLTKND